MNKHLFFLIILLAPLTSLAQGWFRYVPYGGSLYSDVHPNFVRWELIGNSNHSSYDWENTGKNFRSTVTGNFGFELPIWSKDFHEGKYGISVIMAASATLWMDAFQKVTAPVTNTDYRIGLPTITFINRVNKGFLKNYSVAFTPFKHESTHIGDELTLEHEDRGYPLRRVNVSYNYIHLVGTINEPEDRTIRCHTFRAGLMILYDFHDGWYQVYPTDGDESLLSKGNAPWEAYVQYQYQSNTSKHGLQCVVSAEVRNRALYGYTYDGIGKQDEGRVFTYNGFIGARYNCKNYKGIFSHFSAGIRGYYGNCPYGQFRNLNNYYQIGLCLIIE